MTENAIASQLALSFIDCDALLAAYVDRQDDDAFAEITRRYIHFVHGVACRSLSDATSADDVAQAVFVVLAQKAASIKSGAALGAWLHQTTLYVAANTRKTLSRRRYHERHAANLRSETVMSDNANEAIRAQLDTAIASLAALDRSVILSRYFEGTTTAEIGRRIGIGADAAQKRIERAVEKLRVLLSKPATPVTLAAVTTALVASSAHAAPPALAATASQTALHAKATSSPAGTPRQLLQQIVRPKWAALAAVLIGLGIWAAWAGSSNNPTPQSPQSRQVASPTPTTAPTQLSVITTPATMDDRVAIQGIWEFIVAADRGRVAPPEQMKAVTCIITDSRIGIRLPRPKNKEMATYTLNTKMTPKQIDQVDAENTRRTVPGIYELDGNTLRIYFDDRNLKRPTAFPDAAEKAKMKLWILRRVEAIPAR